MGELDIERLAEAVAQFNDLDQFIKSQKEIIRTLSQEEVNEINETTSLHIDRSPKTFTTYSAEYKAEEKKLKEKYPPEKEVKENYNITLTLSNATIIRKVAEVQKLAKNNITTLRKLSASVSKCKRK